MSPILQEKICGTIQSNEEKQTQEALARFKAVLVRPSVVAANAFFEGNASRDWRNLPGRLESLAQALESWVSHEAFHPELLGKAREEKT